MGTTWRPYAQGFFQRQIWYDLALWQFPEVSQHVECTCLRLHVCGLPPTDWTGLPCDVPGVIVGNVALVGVLDHGASGLQPRTKQTGAEELSVPKLSLALSHQCPHGVCEAKGANKSRGKGQGRLAAEDLPGAPAGNLTLSPPASIAAALSVPSRNNGSWSSNVIIELQCGLT